MLLDHDKLIYRRVHVNVLYLRVLITNKNEFINIMWLCCFIIIQ